MSLEEKARKLVGDLQTVLEEAQNADKKKAAEREKLSWQEIRALRAVGRERCCPMTGLADAICLSLSSATGIIDRLVDKKLVRRDRSAEDRRVVQVALTDAGHSAIEETMAGPVEFARGLLRDLSAAEQDEAVAVFRKVAERLRARKQAA